MRKTLALPLLMAACTGDNVEGIVLLDTASEDTVGPVIQHDPVTAPQIYGEDVWLDAIAEDQQGSVWVVVVVYQPETSNTWMDMPLKEVGGGLFQGKIQGNDVWSGGMRYFIRAIDDSGNESCLPLDCEQSPWHFAVVPKN